jgi:hypothetical protein
MEDNSNVSFGVEIENHNERVGQLEQIINPYPTMSDPEFVETHNKGLAARVAALPAALREARAAAIARSL